MKVSCTHFQCAAWAFQHLRDNFDSNSSPDMNYNLLTFQSNIMLVSDFILCYYSFRMIKIDILQSMLSVTVTFCLSRHTLLCVCCFRQTVIELYVIPCDFEDVVAYD